MNIDTTIENVNLVLDTYSYNNLTNKPKINSVELSGNKTSDNLGLQSKLTPGDNITITNNVISSTGGGTLDYEDLENKPSVNNVSLVGNLTTSDLNISYNDLEDLPTIPTKTSELINDSNFVSDISGKQDLLTAGDNITINNNTISAVDTTYTAGTNINIENNVISATGLDIATDTLNNKLESYVKFGEVVDIASLNTQLENKIQGVT